jgi:acyl-CoA hydrolase
MKFHIIKWDKPKDLNPKGTLFWGRLLAWIDEEVALYSIIQLENPRVITKHMSKINFKSSTNTDDIVDIVIDDVKFGNTSVVLTWEVRFIMTRETIITVDSISMVNFYFEIKPLVFRKIQI